ncbi:hypothetical protein [Deinococcus aestuarii]|uniref:hypothetical protein n=1 Tax=Deinococcus aestuarii TaxID=2774531 RepID=UPI001C0CE43B|nr:hypothetical protein [Deinococcus aestuarii]
MVRPPLSRAHRRFLGLVAPVDQSGDFVPLQRLVFAPGCREILIAHLATAGVARSGFLIGRIQGETLHVRLVLPAGYPGYLPPGDPLAIDGAYVLGAVDAARMSTGEDLDWVGSWVMRADGLAAAESADHALWRQARHRALVSPQAVLVTVGQGRERLVVRAYAEDDGVPLPLEVVWEHGRDRRSP